MLSLSLSVIDFLPPTGSCGFINFAKNREKRVGKWSIFGFVVLSLGGVLWWDGCGCGKGVGRGLRGLELG